MHVYAQLYQVLVWVSTLGVGSHGARGLACTVSIGSSNGSSPLIAFNIFAFKDVSSESQIPARAFLWTIALDECSCRHLCMQSAG